MRRLVVVLSLSASLVLTGPSSVAQDDPLDRARAALALSKYDVAEAALGEAKGQSLESAFLRTLLYLRTGRYDEAEKTAAQGARLGAEAKRTLAPWHAEALVRRGKLTEALKVVAAVESDDEAHRAHVVHGELLIQTGKRSEARAPLMKVIKAYNDDVITSRDVEGLSLVGRAAYLLRAYKNANDAFNEAERAGANKRVETLLWRADLFLDKYDPGHAAQVVSEAAKLAPKDPRLLVTIAHVKLAQALDFASAEKLIDEALAIDPKLAEAYFVRAGLALRTLDIEGADAALDKGLAVNPTDLDLLSMKAATRFLADDEPGFQKLEERVLALNPEFSRFYSIVSEYAEWEHRYEDIVAMMRKAVAIDDLDSKAYAQLGLNLIRNGEEKEGRAQLEKAWNRDKFNVRVYNTLNLYDDTIDKEYVTVEGATFRIRYHQSERAVLERYVPAMLKQAWGSMVKRYGFTPATPVGIELYADAQSFSIRTSGLPAVGIQGVCFGKTLAAQSPGAGSFNWGMILWHELAHVFHIQMSKSHVPRWFTEGLAEYETIIQRPEWQREEHLALYHGLRDGKIPEINSFNRAFTHVDSAQDVVMAYFAASQIAVFLAEEFGFDKVAQMLPAWASGQRTPEAVKRTLGITDAELDRRFRAWLKPRLARYDKQFVPRSNPPESVEVARKAVADAPESADALVALARAMLQEGQGDQAQATLKLALVKSPKHLDARYLQLQLALSQKKVDDAKKLVKALIRDGGDGYSVQMKAADIAELDKDKKAMRDHFYKAHRFDPIQAEPIAALYDLANKEDDDQTQLWALRQLAQIEQHDRRVWRRLLAMLIETGAWEEARQVGESAIYVDVMNPELHFMYARALARTGRQVSAIFELNSALLAKPEPQLAVKIYAMMAEGYDKLGKTDYAARARKYEEHVRQLAPTKPDDESLR
jgi:cellulose synthase operon protein C